MKKLVATIAMSAVAFSVMSGVIFTPIGPAKVNLTAITQETNFHQTGGKTNSTATATNITSIYKATTASVPFDGSDLLNLLTNSFNTTFPAGAQIGMRLGLLVVVDSTGTNVLFSPSGGVSIQFDEDFTSGMETLLETENSTGNSFAGNETEVFTLSATITYDDTALAPTDGKHTKFAFKGLYMMNYSENIKNRLVKTTSTFQGTAGGTVRGVPTILTGTITVKASGALPTPT